MKRREVFIIVDYLQEKLKDSNKKNKKIPLINGNAKTDPMERYDDISSIVAKQGKEPVNGVTKVWHLK